MAAVALYAALHAGATSANIRAASIITSLPVLLALYVYSYVDFDTFLVIVPIYALLLGVFNFGPYISWKLGPRVLGILFVAILLLGSFPAGLVASREPPEISGGGVTVTLNEKLAGVTGTRAGSACAYEGVELVQVDPNWLIFRRHGDRSAWVVPMSNVISIGVRPPDLNGPSC